MDIVLRNFFRLLRSGVFGQSEEVEPMSAWKWQQVYRLAKHHHVSALAYDGIGKCSDQFFMHLPETLAETWQQDCLRQEEIARQRNEQVVHLINILAEQHFRPILLSGQALASIYPNPGHRAVELNVEVFFPFSTQGKKADEWARQNGTAVSSTARHTLSYEWGGAHVVHRHRLARLMNRMNNHTLQGYIERELLDSHNAYAEVDGRHVETVPPSLQLFLLILCAAQSIVGGTLSLQQLLDIGVFLRTVGDQVDYVKLQDWISGIHTVRMAQLISLLLQELLRFTPEELPFVQRVPQVSLDKFLEDIYRGEDAESDDDSWSVRRSTRYLRYYPSEGVANLLSGFRRVIPQVEE